MRAGINKTISIVGCIVSIFLHGLTGGFEQGQSIRPGAWESGYSLLANQYFFIFFASIAYLIALRFKNRIVRWTGFVCALVITVYSFVMIYLQKQLSFSTIEDFSSTREFNSLMFHTVPLDLFLVVLVVLLVIYEIRSFILLPSNDA